MVIQPVSRVPLHCHCPPGLIVPAISLASGKSNAAKPLSYMGSSPPFTVPSSGSKTPKLFAAGFLTPYVNGAPCVPTSPVL